MPVSPKAAYSIGLQICRGVAAFHSAGYISRDVKPGNIVLRKRLASLNDVTEGNEIVIIDGGLAVPCQGPGRHRVRCDYITGTVGFMAAEQLDDAFLASYLPGPEIDAVGLGRSLLLLYTTCIPFEDVDDDALIDSVRDGTLMSCLFPDCSLPSPAAFTNVSLWLAEDDPSNRLSVSDAIPVFEYMLGRAAVGDDVQLGEVEAMFGIGTHPLLSCFPVVGGQERSDSDLLSCSGYAPDTCDATSNCASPTSISTATTSSSGTEATVTHDPAALPPGSSSGPSLTDALARAPKGTTDAIDISAMASAMRRSTLSAAAGADGLAKAGIQDESEGMPEATAVNAPSERCASASPTGEDHAHAMVDEANVASAEKASAVDESPRIPAWGERVTMTNCGGTPQDAGSAPAGVEHACEVENEPLV